MAAPISDGIFSLELLVDWVRLEVGVLPPPTAAEEQEQKEEEEEEEQEQEQETLPPRPRSSLCPAVAFRLLDFPTLLVYPPGGPAAPAPEPRPGLLSFGRGKSCLFRLHPATLRRGLLGTPLYTLLLQLPPGRPTPAPQLLGACSISLAAVAHRVLGPAASGRSQGHRGSFPLQNHVGERIGDIALSYRLTDLGHSLLGPLEQPGISTGGGLGGLEVVGAGGDASQASRDKQLQGPLSEPSPGGADRPMVGVKIPKTQKDLKEIVSHSKTSSHNLGSVQNGKTSSVCSNASGAESVSPPSQEGTELDIETNTFCPPPLYYTHLTQEKTPPAQGEITIKPLMNAPEELGSAFLEEKLVNTPTPVNLLKHTSLATHESPPVLINPPHVQDVGEGKQSTSQPHTEQNRINTIRQLPLLNALLVELSVLNNQPMANPPQIHPHLAWLYKTEDKKSPEPSAKSTCKLEYKKSKLPMEENEKSVSFQYKKNQVENLKKGKHFEKNSDIPKRRVPRGKLRYGLTNTLRLRLKQTNPDVLIVHEKREQYREMQAQMLGAKFRIPASKIKVFSFAEQHQKPRQLPTDKRLESDVSFVENSGTSKQISVFDELSPAKESKLKCATEETVNNGGNRTNNSSLEEILSLAHSVLPERFTCANILEGKVETKVQSPCVSQQVAAVDRIVVDTEMGDKQVRTTADDSLSADVSENKASKSSCSESISELNYSDDFTSPCYSDDFCTTEGSSRILQAHDRSPESSKHSQCTSKSSETRVFIRKSNSEKSSILSPPYSAGSPVHSNKKSRISKTLNKSLEEVSTISTSDLSSYWTEEKESQIDQNRVQNSEVIKRTQDISLKPEMRRTGFKSLEKSQASQTSQVSSYLPSDVSELELNVLDCSTSDHFAEDEDVGLLTISKQCKDICELVINKLPGYTV